MDIQLQNHQLQVDNQNLYQKNKIVQALKQKQIGLGGYDEQLQSQDVALKSQQQKRLKNSIHTVVQTENIAYQNIQMRLFYQSYVQVKAMKDGDLLTGFTRILSVGDREYEDPLKDEMNTYKIYNISGLDDYPPAKRPRTMLKWLQLVLKHPSLLQGNWIHLADPDVLWIQPIPSSIFENIEINTDGFTQEISYLNPLHSSVINQFKDIMIDKVLNIEQIQRIGAFPTLTQFKELYKVCDKWDKYMDLVMSNRSDGSFFQKVGWVREMYTFALAAHMTGVKYQFFPPQMGQFMTQLPTDKKFMDSAYFHYTWAIRAKAYKGQQSPYVWEFEKRIWQDDKLIYEMPYIKDPPPYNSSWYNTWDEPFTYSAYNATLFFLKQLNQARQNLPHLQKVIL